MNELADAVGIDPLDLRLANFAEVSPADGRPWSSNRLREAYAEGARRYGWRTRHDRPSQAGHAHFVHTCHAPRSRSPERPLAGKRGYDHALVERASRWGAAVRRSLMRAALPVSPRR